MQNMTGIIIENDHSHIAVQTAGLYLSYLNTVIRPGAY